VRPVDFAVPAEVAYDYLVDPRNRPEWQSSLRRVELLDEVVAVGQRWVDVTWAGVRPAMRTTALDRPQHWSEIGRWRGITATLSLDFAPAASRCQVTARFAVIAGPLGPALTRMAGPAVRADLRRAARILSERAAGH
jgi:hypothetical protein